MLQLKNTTPFAANMAVLPDAEGVDSLYLNVKATFKIGKEWTLAKEQVPPQDEDVYWEEPGLSSLKNASDCHLGKPTTDIVMLGQACAPHQKAVSQLDVTLRVADLSKTVRVFGDRVWHNGRISAPARFQTMPLVYERAFGGTVSVDGEVKAAEERNPVGVGFRGNRSEEEMEGESLPNLEDPGNLIRSIDDCPEPACFAFRAPNWQPRVGFAGTYDEAWTSERAPFLPLDHDARFFNTASPGLIAPGYLQGGEAVEITGMHPEGKLTFKLPYVNLQSRVKVSSTTEVPVFNLETVILEPNQLQVSLVWKAALRCDKRIRKIQEASIALAR